MARAEANAGNPARGREMRQNLLSKLRAPPLTHSWDFWHDRQDRAKQGTMKNGAIDRESSPEVGNYEDRLVHMTSINDVRAFWSTFNNFDITQLPLRDSIHLFHRGIKPVWEDPRNSRGGSWTFRVPKEKAPEFWKEICMMAIGEQLQQAVASNRMTFIDDICGVSLSIRFTSTLIQIWNRDATHTHGINRILELVMSNISDELKPKESACYYKKHAEHSGFHSSPTDGQPADPKAVTNIAPIKQMDDETYMPTRSDAPRLMVEDEDKAEEIRDRMAGPGGHNRGSPHSGVRSQEEASKEVDDTLGAMKHAMDRIGERNGT